MSLFQGTLPDHPVQTLPSLQPPSTAPSAFSQMPITIGIIGTLTIPSFAVATTQEHALECELLETRDID